ncbi:MAG: hypothetical protein ABIP94_12075 [Planctomycetota bacterium]
MPRRLIFWSLAAVAVLAAVWQACALRWTCDDAFISFRYAQNFAEGHGLVFNLDPNEAAVEGYTNFSWTMWLAIGVMLVGGDVALELWSVVSGVVCHGGVVLLLASLAWRASSGRALVPIAACAYAAIHHAASLAPAGLETALFVLLATVLLRFALSLRCYRNAWLAGFVGVLIAMTRPDGAIFVAMTGLFVLFDAWRRRAPRLVVGYVVPFVLVFVPYLLWRHAYYGYWVPNTSFAKSAGVAYPELGWPYVRDFVLCYWALLLALVLPVWFVVKKPDLLANISSFLGRRPWLAMLLFTWPYLGFVVWVGGDFMFARFVLPVLPAVLLAFDVACQRWRPLWMQPVIAAALVVGLTLRVEPELLKYELAYSDNRRISMGLVDIARTYGEYLQKLFAGLDVRLGIAGAHANLAYRSRAPVAIECATGLTDAYIAHLPITGRGKPGHERSYWLYPDYLVQRGVQFMFELNFGKEIRDGVPVDVEPWRQIDFPVPGTPIPLPARLVTWDRKLMQELRRRDPGIVVQDFEQFLDAYIAELPNKTKAQVAADFARFRPFYFDREGDPARRQAFEAFLR